MGGNSWSYCLWYSSTGDCSACAPGTHSSGVCQMTLWMQCVKLKAKVPCLGNKMDEHLAPPMSFVTVSDQQIPGPLFAHHCIT